MTDPDPDQALHLTQQASDKKQGLTIDELGRFLQTVHRLGVDGSNNIRATVGWGGQIQQIRIGRQ